jgi:type IV pilus assembly protein PilA
MSNRGFTLIEILLVIGLIAILAAIVIIAINPARQFAQARDTQRFSDVNAILNAVHQNMIDNKGTWTCDVDGDTNNDPVPSSPTNIGSGGADYDLCDCVEPLYLPTLPYDPVTGVYSDCTTYSSDYWISQSTGGRITVNASSAELVTISVTR